jgi:phosphorylcholine metabolism protein LicD
MITINKYVFHKRKKAFIKYGIEALYAFDDAMKELKINYWLEFGTLLGAIREKRFIPHDFDIDVGAFIDDYNERNEFVLNKYGLKRKRIFLVDTGSYAREETYTYKGVNIDIFYFHKRDGEIYCHGFEESQDLIEGYIVRELSFKFSGLKYIDFYGRQILAPANVDEHLKASYGENYMLPDPNFTNESAKNVTILKEKKGILIKKRWF